MKIAIPAPVRRYESMDLTSAYILALAFTYIGSHLVDPVLHKYFGIPHLFVLPRGSVLGSLPGKGHHLLDRCHRIPIKHALCFIRFPNPGKPVTGFPLLRLHFPKAGFHIRQGAELPHFEEAGSHSTHTPKHHTPEK